MMLYEKEKINRHLYLSSEISREELAPIIQAIELIFYAFHDLYPPII